MAATTLGSPNFNPAILGTSTTPLPSSSIILIGGSTSTAMIGETDPIFSGWDKHTGITIHQSQIIPDPSLAVPTGLVATPKTLDTGAKVSAVKLQWNAVSGASYGIRYKRSTYNEYTYLTTVDTTVLHDFAVCSINANNVYSAYCTVVTATTLADTIAPVVTTGVVATAGSGSVTLTWNPSIEVDLAGYNIYRKTTDVPATSTKIATINSTYFVDTNLVVGQIQYYWVKAIDTSGNECASYSIVASATPTDTLTLSALETLLGVNRDNIATINPTTGKISSNTIGTFTLDDNSVTASKILNGSIAAAKLSVAAIDATGNLNVNTVGTSQINGAAITAAQVANDAITANALATDAVTGPAIQAGAIIAGKIGANAVTASTIAAGAVTANKITSYNFMLSEGTITGNTPTDSVTWTGCKVVYLGTEYTITNGSCTVGHKHIYWELATPTVFSSSLSLPALTNDGFLVAYNNVGVSRYVWNSTIIDGNRITTGSVTASNIAVGTLTATEIASNAITADKILAGAVTANKIKSYNFMLNSTTDGAVWTNNTGTGIVSWTGVKVTYDGTTYTITNGSCDANDVFIYWENGATTFSHSLGLPVLHNGDFIVGTNGSTSRNIAPGTMIFNQSGTVIDGNTISTGSITAGQIAVGTITANLIGADEIRAEHIRTGEIEAVHLSVAAGATFMGAVGGSYATAPAYPNLKIFPTADPTIGMQALDNVGSNVFKIEVSGTNVGDVTIGNYSGGQGIKYDQSANTTYFAGNVTATSGAVGGFTINVTDGIYSGTGATRVQMKPGAGFWAGADAQGSAPFSVSASGSLTASGVASFGTATATVDSKIQSLAILGPEIWENSLNSDDGNIYINRIGYNGGTTKFRDFAIGNGKGGYLLTGDGSTGTVMVASSRLELPPIYTTAQINAIATPGEGLIVWNSTTNRLNVFNGSVWQYIAMTTGN
jgi:hypothetical protein